MGEEESKRNISDEWIRNNVYEALETIEEAERRMMLGCVNLMEYIQLQGLKQDVLPQIELQNMRIMINEFHILIENTKELLKPKDYKDVRMQVKFYMDAMVKGYIKNGEEMEKIYTTPRRKNGRIVILYQAFTDIANGLSKLRSQMVQHLAPILFIKGKRKPKEEED